MIAMKKSKTNTQNVNSLNTDKKTNGVITMNRKSKTNFFIYLYFRRGLDYIIISK